MNCRANMILLTAQKEQIKKSELNENNRYWTRNILYTKKPRNKINYVLNSNTKGIARVL